MRLGNYFYEMHEKAKNMLDILVKQQFNSWDRLASMKHDDIDGLKAVDEAYTALSEYVEHYTEMMEVMMGKLDEIQDELKSLKYDIDDIKKEQA